MEDAGAGAVVMFSLFEEQIKQEQAAYDVFTAQGSESFAEALSYFTEANDYHASTDEYLDLVERASNSVDIPVIDSLNGITSEGWIQYAKHLEQAGANALELNIFFIPADISMTGREVEQRYLEILKTVKASVSIPVAVKLNPYFSSMGHMANELAGAGANALVLFNRFYQPDMDIHHLEIVNSLELSSANEIRVPLLWLAILHSNVSCSLAASTGVNGSKEFIKYLLAGADVVMTASALLRNGIPYLKRLLAELEAWLEPRDFASLSEMRGLMSQKNIPDPNTYERANYIKILEGYQA